MQQTTIFPSAPHISKPNTDFRTKMFGPLDTRNTPLKNKSMYSFPNDTPSSKQNRANNSFFVRRSHDKLPRARTLTPTYEARRSLQTTSFKLLDNFLSQINFSPATILKDKEIPSPCNIKESPVFIRKITKSSSSKSKKVVSSLDNLPDTPPQAKRQTIGKLEFSNLKELPSSLDAIPEATDFEIEELNICVRRERGSSVDSGMKGLANRYRRKVEPGMFMKRKKMTSIENIIEEVEEISTYRGRDENNSRIKQDFDDDSEEWRCTSSSSFIVSKLSRNNSRVEDYNKGNLLDKELFDFIKKRLSRKESRVPGKQDKEIVRESFSQELLKMKDAIENALILCHESSKDFIINASP